MNVKNVDTILRNILEEKKARQFEHVYELSEDDKFYKLVFSIHGLNVEMEDESVTTIVHTKFIFRTDTKKQKLVEDSFWYLKDINCIYNKVDFESVEDLEYKLKSIITEDKFGKNLRNISDFISEAPASSMNDYLNKRDITEFTITNVEYNPKFKMFPCEETKFDFEISINNGLHIVKMSIKKVGDIFKIYYYILDEVIEKDVDNINQLSQLLTDQLITIYREHLS